MQWGIGRSDMVQHNFLQGVLEFCPGQKSGNGLLCGAQGSVAPCLEELLHRQSLVVHLAAHPAPAFAPGQTLAGEQDVPAQRLAAVGGLQVEMQQVQGGVSIFQAK